MYRGASERAGAGQFQTMTAAMTARAMPVQRPARKVTSIEKSFLIFWNVGAYPEFSGAGGNPGNEGG
jgi:hypothetical protein